MAAIETIVTIKVRARISRSLRFRFRTFVSLIVAKMRSTHEIRRSRRALERLTESDLRDIGLTRARAVGEYRRSFYID